jgi:hypothetical protein
LTTDAEPHHHRGMRLRSFVLPLVLVAMAAQLAELAATRGGVGPFEYVTVVALIAGLLWSAYRLVRRAIPRA